MTTSHGVDRHNDGSVGHYCVRFLRGTLELDFPGRAVEVPTAPALVGPLIVLALRPRQSTSLETFKTSLWDVDPAHITTQQIQTPISRLRLLGLPIPPRQYLLDVAPADVDVIDFNHRAKALIDRGVLAERGHGGDIDRLIDEGCELHQLWQEDPGAVVGDQPRQYALFERHRRRHRRLGEVLVRLLVRVGDRDRAGDILYEYVDRYGTDEDFQDLDRAVRGLTRPGDRDRDRERDRDTPAGGIAVPPLAGLPGLAGLSGAAGLPGPFGEGSAVDELRDRTAATTHLAYAQVAVSAHNLDLIEIVDKVGVNHVSRTRGLPVEAAGGAGANTAFALARLGHPTAVAGMIADDRDGNQLRQSLELEGVDMANLLVVPSSPGARTGRCSIYSDRLGGRVDFVRPGVNEHLARHLGDDKVAKRRLWDALREARLVNLSSFTGDAERRLQEEILHELPSTSVVTFAPGDFYTPLGLDRLRSFVVRCDVLFVSEDGLRQMLVHSSASADPAQLHDAKVCIEVLFRWRASRAHGRPLVVVVRHDVGRGTGVDGADTEDVITLAVGRSSIEDLAAVGPRASLVPLVADITGETDAIAAGVHLGLLHGAPLTECVDVAFVLANEANSEIGCRAGLPRTSTVAAAWDKYFPDVELPPWVTAP